MIKRNYQLEMERELAKVAALERRPRLLLHSCCAPCSSYVLELLEKSFDITVFYYNPNIAPREEFLRRAEEQRRLIERLPHQGAIELMTGAYDDRAFYELAKGYEQEPEGGERCTRCFNLRLGRTAQVAAEGRFDYFTTTLSISPLKDAQRLNAIGARLAGEWGVPYLFSDFKKKNGYKRSCELSEDYGLYRQDYCGCVFSRMARDRRIKEKELSPEIE